MTKSLPLPPRFFPCPPLTPREAQHLVGKAKESAKALVDATRNNDGPVRWEEAGTHRGVQLYKGEARYPERVVGNSITYGCGATTIQSTLDEIADFFDLSTDDKVAALAADDADVLDSQLLYVLQDPVVLNDPTHATSSSSQRTRRGTSHMLNVNQVTVKWCALDVPSKLMKNRDFLTVECQSTFLDASGRRGWVRAYHSIKLPCCPDLSDYNLVRGSFYHTGYVFVESERVGLLDVLFSAQVNMRSSVKVPTALYMTIQKKRLSSIAELQKLITRRRLGTQHFLGDLELVLKSQRKRCNLCLAKFGLITRKARCRKCGEVVCASACSMEWEVSILGQGVRKIRVCSKCAQNTDPSVFEDLPPSEQYSDNSVHEDDLPMMSVRAPGYQYDRRSDTGSSSLCHGKHSLDSNDYDSFGDYRRQSVRRGPYSNSYEESYSQNDSYHDSDPENARTTGIASAGQEGERYTNDSSEYDEPPSSRRWRDDRRYDPRNPDIYDHETYGVSPPQYRDDEQKRALQRQQRALQQQQNKRRLLQRQQQQQEALMHRQQQYQEPDSCSAEQSSIECSESTYSSANSDALPSFLTSSQLARHTKQMGKPGPVTRNERDAAQRAVQQQQQHARRRKKPKADAPRRLPPPSLSTDRPLTQLEQLQVQLWAEQEAKFREQVTSEAPFDFEVETAEPVLSNVHHQRASSLDSSAKGCGLKLPSFFRSPDSSTHSQGQGALTDEVVPPFVKKAQVTNLGQRTVSVADDEDGLDTSLNELAINFGSLLRPEDLRPTEESIRLSVDSSGQDYSPTDDSDAAKSGKTGASAAKCRSDASKATVVKLYQQILELTNKQHELEAQPESEDSDEKKKVALELEALYAKLHSEVET